MESLSIEPNGDVRLSRSWYLKNDARMLLSALIDSFPYEPLSSELLDISIENRKNGYVVNIRDKTFEHTAYVLEVQYIISEERISTNFYKRIERKDVYKFIFALSFLLRVV